MHDLNIRLKSTKEKDLRAAVKRIFELGWDCVAWTTLANGKILSNLKPIKAVMLEPIQRRDALELRSLVTGSTAIPDVRQMSRITVTIDDIIDAQSLTVGNAILNAYDIVAARPGNIKVMAYLCKTAEIDIITLDFTHRLPFAINKKLLDEAAKRGIFIEIIYNPIIGPVAGARQEVFSNTRILIQYLRGKNIILSSGADAIGQIRGPMDVCNIGVALGLNLEQATNAVSNNCAMVLKHAVARKNRFLPIEVVSRLDFKLRYPEANLDESQSSGHNVPYVFSENVLSTVLSNGRSDALSDSGTMKIDMNNNNDDDNDDDDEEEEDENGGTQLNELRASAESTEVEVEIDVEMEEEAEVEENEEAAGEDENDDDIVGFEVSPSGDIKTFEDSVAVRRVGNGTAEEGVEIVEDNDKDNEEEEEGVDEDGSLEDREQREQEQDEQEQAGEKEDSFDLGDSFISFSSSSSSKRGRESRVTDSDMDEALKPMNPALKISVNATNKYDKQIKKKNLVVKKTIRRKMF